MADPREGDYLPHECECPKSPDGWRWHHAECPAVGFIRDVQRRLQPSLDEMARLRRRAEAEARFHVIG